MGERRGGRWVLFNMWWASTVNKREREREREGMGCKLQLIIDKESEREVVSDSKDG